MQSIESKMGNENEQWEIMIGQEVYQADSETIKQWIAEGRLLADDKIKKANLNWIEVKRVPNFRNLLSTTNPNTQIYPNIEPKLAPNAIENQHLYNQNNQSSTNPPYANPPTINNVVTSNQNPNQEPLANYVNNIRENQDLNMAIAAGIISAVVGACVWGIFVAITEYQFVFMGILAGLFVGFSVRKFGKGIDTSFGIVGAICSLICCLAGTVIASCIMVASATDTSFLKIIFNLNFNLVTLILKEGFGPIDLLIYGFAIYEGYKISFRSDYDLN